MSAKKVKARASAVILTVKTSGECLAQAIGEDGYWHLYPCDERHSPALNAIARDILRQRRER